MTRRNTQFAQSSANLQEKFQGASDVLRNMDLTDAQTSLNHNLNDAKATLSKSFDFIAR